MIAIAHSGRRDWKNAAIDFRNVCCGEDAGLEQASTQVGFAEGAASPERPCQRPYWLQMPHQSAMKSVIALVMFRNEARSTRLSKPWMNSVRGP